MIKDKKQRKLESSPEDVTGKTPSPRPGPADDGPSTPPDGGAGPGPEAGPDRAVDGDWPVGPEGVDGGAEAEEGSGDEPGEATVFGDGELPEVELISDAGEKRLRQRKKRRQDGKEAGRRKRTDQEVLTRLLEKNEVILQLTKKNTELEAQVKALEDKRIRAAAEFENYRKRTRKEWELLKQQTTGEVILEFLNIVDDFERALAVAEDKDDDFVQGIRLIYNNILSVLEAHGVIRMRAENMRFDPALHMAVANVESDEVEPNHVLEVIQHGYLMNGNVIRPAKVVIAK